MVHSIGGVHVGCGISILIWFFLYTLFIGNDHLFIRIFSQFIYSLLICIIITSIPQIRQKNHDLFEDLHRYLGWLSLALLIIFVIVSEQIKQGYVTIYENPNIWIMFIIATFIIHPCLFLKRVNVKLGAPSTQCTVVTIEDCVQTQYHGRFLRLASNFGEFHAFAVALSNPKEKNIQVVAAAAGGWTKNLIKTSIDQSNKVHKMWLRRIFGTGFMYSINAYKKVMIVATGSGIAPVLPYIQTPQIEAYILWIASDHAKHYGSDLMDLINSHKPQVKMLDTKKDGRPNAELIVKEFKNAGDCEAVFVVSNPSFTFASIYHCTVNNIQCYGAMWDS